MDPHPGLTRVFFDGPCGLCQSAVRFVARRDDARGIRFAPLGGSMYLAALSPAVRANLPDTLVVLTATGDVLLRTAAVRHLLARLGPGWRLLGWVLGCLPPHLLDGGYDWVARHRPRDRGCPLPESGEDRFDP